MKNIADDLADDLSRILDAKNKADLIPETMKSYIDTFSGSDHALKSITATGAVAMGVAAGIVFGGTGVLAVGAGTIAGEIGVWLYGKTIEHAKEVGSRAGEAARDLRGDEIDSNVDVTYRQSRGRIEHRDPLILDLDGDAVLVNGQRAASLHMLG